MKKMLLVMSLAIGFSCVFGGCSNSENGGSPEQTYTITFKQAGQEDIVKEVKKGEDLSEIPTPKSKTGYTVEWDTTDFLDITADMVVTAVATANTYTITYDAGEGILSQTTQEVVYDSTPTLATPTLEGYTFTGWTYNGTAVLGKWTIANDVTLVASWVKDAENTYTVIFRQNGQTDKVYENVAKGSTFTDIPAVVSKVGYTVKWNETHLAELINISGNVVVEAIEEVKTYTITLNANGGTVGVKTITITYGEEYTLAKATHEDYKFVSWTYDGKEISLTGVWEIDVEETNIELVAKWGKRSWTGIY